MNPPGNDRDRQQSRQSFLKKQSVNLTENEFIYSFASSDLHKAVWELHQDGYVNMATVNSIYWKKFLIFLIAHNQ